MIVNILRVGARDLYDEVFKLLKEDIFYILVNPVEKYWTVAPNIFSHNL